MSIWIPALHAGMTKVTAFALTERNAFSDLFKREHEEMRSRAKRAKDAKFGFYFFLRVLCALCAKNFLRALRALRGELFFTTWLRLSRAVFISFALRSMISPRDR